MFEKRENAQCTFTAKDKTVFILFEIKIKNIAIENFV